MSKLPPIDLKARIQKLEAVLADPVESTGSIWWPKELENSEYDYRAINNDDDEPFSMSSAYKIGWENLGVEEATLFRNHMGHGIFTAGSNGDGGIVEIPVSQTLRSRIVKRHKTLSEVVERHYEQKIDKIQKSLGYDLAYGPQGKFNNNLISTETDVNMGTVR